MCMRRGASGAAGHGTSRRALFGGGMAAAAGAVGALGAARPAAASVPGGGRVLDLSYTYDPGMPTFHPEKPSSEVIAEPPPDGEMAEGAFYDLRWTLNEHAGTHLDAPAHVVGGTPSVHEIAAQDLVAPVAVVDVSRRVADDPDTVVTPADIESYERRHGRVPEGAAVVMHSGWGRRWHRGDEAFRGAEFGGGEPYDYHFPGFGADACEMLVHDRGVRGLAVDTLSTDPGNSQEFPVHEALARAGRWGLECLADVHRLPPRGATLVVGVVPFTDGSGGPCRAIALTR